MKTKSSRRIIPIHPELKRIGFLEYAEGLRHQGERRLFPDLPIGNKGYHSDPFQKWFARFLRKASASAPRTSFHGFRHNFRDAMREAKLSTDAVRALGGWAGPTNTSDAYGAGLRIKTLAREIAKIRYAGLDLTHLHLAMVDTRIGEVS